MLKEKLLQEAQSIDASVELDTIFESVELSPEVQEKFKTVFESVVKQKAVELAESHINAIAESAENQVTELVEAQVQEAETRLVESADIFCKQLAQTWLEENQVAIDRGIKADLFESFAIGLKDLFAEHNVIIPEQSVDVVAELEEELQESAALTESLLNEKNKILGEFNSLKRKTALAEATEGLTLTQIEKVEGLVEGLDYSDKFAHKVSAIVDMVKSSRITESVDKPLTENTIINKTNDDANALNYNASTTNTTVNENHEMNAYVFAAKKLV